VKGKVWKLFAFKAGLFKFPDRKGVCLKILGISAFYHDSAAALLVDGDIVAAAQEERFSRIKHDQDFPARAVDYCLREAGIRSADLHAVVFYDKPFLKFERLLSTYLQHAPMGLPSFLKSMPLWIRQKIWTRSLIQEKLPEYSGKVFFSGHHHSHAASAFYPSPFEKAAILTVDGVGEWTTTSLYAADGQQLKVLRELHFPHSLGLLYSAFTYYCGFKVNSGEYKLMGLAPYGEARYRDLILKELIDLREDGSFRLNMKYFNYSVGLTMTNRRFHSLFGAAPRQPESPLDIFHMDLAASIQSVTEEVMLRMARHARQLTGMDKLCLAGGVALNCVANGKILREGIFSEIWMQPAAGDAGGALGAALALAHDHFKEKRKAAENSFTAQKGSYLGPSYSDRQIEAFLSSQNIPARQLKQDELLTEAAALLADEKVLGWFQGRMEFGPRALGNRSILGDARSASMQKTMNLKIKFRESFRPFAPAVLAENASSHFELSGSSPFMLLTTAVAPEQELPVTEEGRGLEKLNIVRSRIPAVTHVDRSARVQTVHRESNPLFHALISRFKDLTGSPVLINTSFNVRGEPIVENPEQAYVCFMRTHMDALVLGNFLLLKSDQPPLQENPQTQDWRQTFALD